MDLLSFYRECAELARRDINKQKMLLPPDSITDLCSQHHRKHRNLAEKLLAGDKPQRIFAIQKAFPRMGTVLADFNALELAGKFAAEKPAALAVVTEKYFYSGEPSMLTGVSHLIDLPIIRWDFIIDEYQIMQSKLWGADAVRVIVPLLDQIELADLYNKAQELELEVIWEIHSGSDAERVAGFTQNSSFFIDGDCLEPVQLENILKKLPENSPALLNGDNINLENMPPAAAGLIIFSPARA